MLVNKDNAHEVMKGKNTNYHYDFVFCSEGTRFQLQVHFEHNIKIGGTQPVAQGMYGHACSYLLQEVSCQ